MEDKTKYRLIGEHRERIGKITFIIRSYDNPNATQTAEQLLLKLMESKIRNEREVNPFRERSQPA
jgi:hypothetical protein